MRTNILNYILSSERRKKVVQTLLESPHRQWSCSSVEEKSGLSHATVFRVLRTLRELGMLKSLKINKKDIVYEVARESLLVSELPKILHFEQILGRRMAKIFVSSLPKKQVVAIILYGSTVKGNFTSQSDIDILIIIKKHNALQEKEMYDLASKLSSRFNKTISLTIMDRDEITQGKKSQFLQSVQEAGKVLYGKTPF